jgi:F420-dependent oxidoreductase-like protein
VRLAANLTCADAVPLARAAENLGYAAVLAGEGAESDAPSLLALVAGQTSKVALVAAAMQIPARPPGLTALTSATLATLSQGRFRLGLGVSNPDISHGWYGVPYASPLGRTREYVDIVRRALRGDEVRYPGRYFQLPGPGTAGTPLRLQPAMTRAAVPVYLAAVGERSLRLAGEIADGWIGVFASPDDAAASVAELERGRESAGRAGLAGFEVLLTAPAAVAADVAAAVESLRGHYAALLGIGQPDQNAYCALARRMGFEREMSAFAERMAADDRRGAGRAIPAALIERTALAGPVPYLAERMTAYAKAGVTTLGIKATAADASAGERLAMLKDAATALSLSGAAG